MPGPDVPGPAGGADRADLADLRERLGRLQGEAASAHKAYVDRFARKLECERFLELAPLAEARLDELTRSLFREVLDEIQENLSHAVGEILGQEREVRAVHDTKRGNLWVRFEIVNQGNTEDIVKGQGGSVCNILSVGLRLVSLSLLDPRRHRPFLVLDEQDCWLRPDLVPRLMGMIRVVCRRLGLQALVISHHSLDLLTGKADRVLELVPDREQGVVLRRVPAMPSGGEGDDEVYGDDGGGDDGGGDEESRQASRTHDPDLGGDFLEPDPGGE